VLISTEDSETNGVCVAVRDSGPGLAPESFEHLFNAFYTTKADGMGMGLSICRASEAGEILRVLIERVVLTPTHDGMRAELHGDLAVNPEVKKPQLVRPDSRRRIGATGVH
jgi:hypothetical protein